MQTLYGLPEEVAFCKLCVISNQRPNSCAEASHTASSKKQTIRFIDGVCDACRVAEAKKSIDWAQRERELIALCDNHRSKDGSYDCLVPGSGGKDSFYQAHVLKHKYGMHPLTITWAPNIYTDIGRQNHSRWIHAGFDNILVTPNGRTHRLVTRLAVENLFHAFQPFIIGQKFLGPKLAAQHNIKLVFYGENEAEYGNPQADTEKAKRDWSYYVSSPSADVFLGGTSLAVLKEAYGLDRGDLSLYMPASPESQKDIQVQYLGYYLKWRPQDAFYYAVEHGGFEPAKERTPGTYSRYNSLDDQIDDFHYWTTYVKFGIGRATYDASQEIRNGEISREDGVARVKRFDGEWPERYAKNVMEYLSPDGFGLEPMTAERMWELSDRFRSPHLWDGRDLRHKVWA
jgi:N-acetyl sugar amidotransferase